MQSFLGDMANLLDYLPYFSVVPVLNPCLYPFSSAEYGSLRFVRLRTGQQPRWRPLSPGCLPIHRRSY